MVTSASCMARARPGGNAEFAWIFRARLASGFCISTARPNRWSRQLIKIELHPKGLARLNQGNQSPIYVTLVKNNAMKQIVSGFYMQILESDWSTTTETLICPGCETSVVPISQPGTPGRDKRGGLATGTKSTLLSRLVLATGTKGPFLSRLPDPGQKDTPPFVPNWHSRLGNRDNGGFPTGTNQRFCSSD